ncbi:ABC transporter ATP-binding protein [Shimazuella alba]|uniref:ATP-binding cassette domain-containing protein n=1 Tax=Shimazuella alba TaxID=2690964 RepID=A0A6I4VQL4_9BACL|nr:ABC transporter ATP-binding protein [Shimazuella alba]MXQ52681.1 ATP-binding cassette domain-containing protein [Shimazuella alba]
MIQVENLMKRYGNQTVVDHISFEVKEREIFGMLGPNGAGKTTTMEMIEGLRDPDDGKIVVAGVDAKRQKKKLKQHIGMQLQSTSLFDYLTVKESIELYASFYPKARPVKELLVSFDLQEKEKTWVKHLSGGQRQRLAIAIAVVHDPKVIFLDEPTTGLDPAARRSLWDIVLQLREEGRTIFLSTHYMEEAEVLCDRIAIMDRGKILALDTPRELIRQLGTNTRIEFPSKDDCYDSEFSTLAGVKKVVRLENDLVQLHTDQLADTLQQLIPLADKYHLPLNGISTRTATLEDVFLEQTGKRLS